MELKKLAASGTVVGLVWTVPPATAADVAVLSCAAYSNVPYKTGGTVKGTGGQSGSCNSKVTVLLKRSRFGPDQVLKSGSRNGPGSVTLSQACDWGSDSWGIYVSSFRDGGPVVNSDQVEIRCGS